MPACSTPGWTCIGVCTVYTECAGIFVSSPCRLWPRVCTQEEPHVFIVTRTPMTPARDQSHRPTPDFAHRANCPTRPCRDHCFWEDDSPRGDSNPRPDALPTELRPKPLFSMFVNIMAGDN